MSPYTKSLFASLIVVVGLAAGIALPAQASDQSSAPSVVDDRRTGATLLSMFGSDTLPSPGISIGITSYDIQHNNAQGHQVAINPGANTVHFAWTMCDEVPDGGQEIGRMVFYNSWDKVSAALNQGANGAQVSLGESSRAGFVRIDVDGENLCHMTYHEHIEVGFPYSAWHVYFPIEGSYLHFVTELSKPGSMPDEVEMLWPDIAIEPNGGTKDNNTDIYHIIAQGCADVGGSACSPSDRIWYWRYDSGDPTPYWKGPVLIDSSGQGCYVIDADENSDKVAVAFTSSYATDGLNGAQNVAYRESQTSGAGWLTGTELGPAFRVLVTRYDDPTGPTAWPDISIAYDHHSTLHIVWTEQSQSGSEDIAVRHWSTTRPTTRIVAVGYYVNPNTWGLSLNLSQVTLGIGDGATLCDGGTLTNEDYLYVLYMKLGGETPEEQADISQLGRANGELYLTVSPDGGKHWSPAVNITNTKTPDCSGLNPDAPCASEAWATIARDVSDIEILYIRDYEPGSFGESIWTLNKVMYLNFPGGTIDAPLVCPVFTCYCPCLGDPSCDGHTDILDIVRAVDVAFRAGTPVFDPVCPFARTDVDCSGGTDVLDVVHLVNVAFRDGNPDTEFCDPCAP